MVESKPAAASIARGNPKQGNRRSIARAAPHRVDRTANAGRTHDQVRSSRRPPEYTAISRRFAYSPSTNHAGRKVDSLASEQPRAPKLGDVQTATGRHRIFDFHQIVAIPGQTTIGAASRARLVIDSPSGEPREAISADQRAGRSREAKGEYEVELVG